MWVSLVLKGKKKEDGKSFRLTAPKEPGVYYVRVRSGLEFSCEDATRKLISGEDKIAPQSNIGIVVVGNVFNLSTYSEILKAYSKNVPSSVVVTGDDVAGDENPNSGSYINLRNFRFNQ